MVMGIVKMKDERDFVSRGYPYYTATLYVYCDRCGSFDIKTYLGLRKWLLIASPWGLVAAVAFKLNRSGIVYLWWVFLGLAIIVLAFGLFWGDADYRCRKCDSIPITKYNTLDYPSNMGIVDVPDHIAKKRYWGYWPDMYDLGEELKPPVQAASAPTTTIKETLHRLGKGVLTAFAVPVVLLWLVIMPVLALVGAVIHDLFPIVFSGTKKRH